MKLQEKVKTAYQSVSQAISNAPHAVYETDMGILGLGGATYYANNFLRENKILDANKSVAQPNPKLRDDLEAKVISGELHRKYGILSRDAIKGYDFRNKDESIPEPSPEQSHKGRAGWTLLQYLNPAAPYCFNESDKQEIVRGIAEVWKRYNELQKGGNISVGGTKENEEVTYLTPQEVGQVVDELHSKAARAAVRQIAIAAGYVAPLTPEKKVLTKKKDDNTENGKVRALECRVGDIQTGDIWQYNDWYNIARAIKPGAFVKNAVRDTAIIGGALAAGPVAAGVAWGSYKLWGAGIGSATQLLAKKASHYIANRDATQALASIGGSWAMYVVQKYGTNTLEQAAKEAEINPSASATATYLVKVATIVTVSELSDYISKKSDNISEYISKKTNNFSEFLSQWNISQPLSKKMKIDKGRKNKIERGIKGISTAVSGVADFALLYLLGSYRLHHQQTPEQQEPKQLGSVEEKNNPPEIKEQVFNKGASGNVFEKDSTVEFTVVENTTSSSETSQIPSPATETPQENEASAPNIEPSVAQPQKPTILPIYNPIVIESPKPEPFPLPYPIVIEVPKAEPYPFPIYHPIVIPVSEPVETADHSPATQPTQPDVSAQQEHSEPVKYTPESQEHFIERSREIWANRLEQEQALASNNETAEEATPTILPIYHPIVIESPRQEPFPLSYPIVIEVPKAEPFPFPIYYPIVIPVSEPVETVDHSPATHPTQPNVSAPQEHSEPVKYTPESQEHFIEKSSKLLHERVEQEQALASRETAEEATPTILPVYHPIVIPVSEPVETADHSPANHPTQPNVSAEEPAEEQSLPEKYYNPSKGPVSPSTPEQPEQPKYTPESREHFIERSREIWSDRLENLEDTVKDTVKERQNYATNGWNIERVYDDHGHFEGKGNDRHYVSGAEHENAITFDENTKTGSVQLDFAKGDEHTQGITNVADDTQIFFEGYKDGKLVDAQFFEISADGKYDLSSVDLKNVDGYQIWLSEADADSNTHTLSVESIASISHGKYIVEPESQFTITPPISEPQKAPENSLLTYLDNVLKNKGALSIEADRSPLGFGLFGYEIFTPFVFDKEMEITYNETSHKYVLDHANTDPLGFWTKTQEYTTLQEALAAVEVSKWKHDNVELTIENKEGKELMKMEYDAEAYLAFLQDESAASHAVAAVNNEGTAPSKTIIQGEEPEYRQAAMVMESPTTTQMVYGVDLTHLELHKTLHETYDDHTTPLIGEPEHELQLTIDKKEWDEGTVSLGPLDNHTIENGKPIAIESPETVVVLEHFDKNHHVDYRTIVPVDENNHYTTTPQFQEYDGEDIEVAWAKLIDSKTDDNGKITDATLEYLASYRSGEGHAPAAHSASYTEQHNESEAARTEQPERAAQPEQKAVTPAPVTNEEKTAEQPGKYTHTYHSGFTGHAIEATPKPESFLHRLFNFGFTGHAVKGEQQAAPAEEQPAAHDSFYWNGEMNAPEDNGSQSDAELQESSEEIADSVAEKREEPQQALEEEIASVQKIRLGEEELFEKFLREQKGRMLENNDLEKSLAA